MDRIVHKSRGFREAEAWDREQQRKMTPQERILAVRELQRRVYGSNGKGVRECHKTP
jgi:hypothetical protein